MDWLTFLFSASALSPHWRVQAAHGLCHPHDRPPEELMQTMRRHGIRMERAMFEATANVNTHKGLIFVLSLLLGAAGICLARGSYTPADIRRVSSEIASPSLAEEQEHLRCRARAGQHLTHGQAIYIEHGIGGIRNEAMNGFPSLEAGLAALEKAIQRGARLRDAAIYALLTLMGACEDTNIIHRAGLPFWRGEYREITAETQKKFDPVHPGDYAPVLALGERLIERNASPGGAADLLACTLFLYRSKIPDNKFRKEARA